MKEYELSVLYHPDLETNLDPALDKVAKLIESNNGKITKIEPDGKKRLAYRLKGQDFAIYYYYDVELPAEAPNKLSSVLNITDEVLRAMFVVKDPRKAKYEEYLKSKAEAEPAEEAAKEPAKKEAEEAEKEEA